MSIYRSFIYGFVVNLHNMTLRAKIFFMASKKHLIQLNLIILIDHIQSSVNSHFIDSRCLLLPKPFCVCIEKNTENTLYTINTLAWYGLAIILGFLLLFSLFCCFLMLCCLRFVSFVSEHTKLTHIRYNMRVVLQRP